jgi:hypothetical protein
MAAPTTALTAAERAHGSASGTAGSVGAVVGEYSAPVSPASIYPSPYQVR